MADKWRFAVLLAVASSAGTAQVPAPPPLPGQDRLGERLVRAIEGKDVTAYAALLSDRLTVFEDGRPVARSKAAWLDTFGRKLVAEGVSFTVAPGYSSTGRLLFIEYFNSAASWGSGSPRHCCWSFDAVAYDIADGKVTTIRRLRGGDTTLDAKGSPIR